MRSEEFFNILDDMDEKYISEIFEDIQRPTMLRPETRSAKKGILRSIIAAAACVTVAAAGVFLVSKGISFPTSPSSDISDNDLTSPAITSDESSAVDPDLYLENFSFAAGMGAYRRGSETDIMTYFRTPENGQLELTVRKYIDPDKSMEDIPVSIRIYFLGDGKPLKFRIPGLTESAYVHEVIPDDPSDFSFDIDLELPLGDEPNTIAAIWNIYPDYIPKKGTGSLNSCCAHLMQNHKCAYDLYVPETDVGYFNISSDIGLIDIGVADLTSSDKIIESHFYDDIMLTPENKDLFIKFNSGSETNIPYYLILFRDGELLDAFDGQYSCVVDCRSGERTFQVKIPESFIPDSGLHTFQAVALPAYAFDQNSDHTWYNSISTSKIRVQIQS